VVIIDSIDAIPLRIPFDHWAPPPLFAGRPRTTLDTVLVRVTTSHGLVGWGEAYGGSVPATVAAIETLVAPLMRGKPVTEPGLAPGLERTLHNLGRSGATLHAISGFDIALWDLRGKMEGVPLHALLGGARRSRVEAYASLLQYGGSLDLVRRNSVRSLEQGFAQVKLHERTAEAVAAARAAIGPEIPLMVDTNCAWTPDQAPAAVRAMASCDLLWVEEPIWPPEDFDALAALRRATGVPTAVGENASSAGDFARMIAADAVDYVQPSVVKIGGVTALWAIAQRAEAADVACVPHVAFFGPGYLASLHVLAAQRREVALERLVCKLGVTPYARTVPVADGWVEVPQGPGLGADPEPEMLTLT
jgi:L-alanine-DL-glutamate epimerase-like enolase superfamily enzyme